MEVDGRRSTRPGKRRACFDDGPARRVGSSWAPNSRLSSRDTPAAAHVSVLQAVRHLLMKSVHGCGSGYRDGGEEVVLILENLDLTEAAAFGEKVRAAFEAYPIRRALDCGSGHCPSIPRSLYSGRRAIH